MRFSRPWKSSPHCLPSPDGKFIATLASPVISIRAVQSAGLDVVNEIKLPPDFSGPIVAFQWSPSPSPSPRYVLLVATADQIRVLSALDDSFQGVIRNPTPPGAKPAYVAFGASEAEVYVCSSLGLKFSIFHLSSSTSPATNRVVEVANPKFFASPSAAHRGFSIRPRTRHLALLTRTAGKDMISIHDYPGRDVRRSFAPDTVDAQSVVWSPDGRWLVVCESAGQGHKVLFYTSDGHIFKIWSGPSSSSPAAHLGLDNRDFALGAGVKTVQFSADSHLLAIGDRSRCVYMFDTASVAESMRLRHPTTIKPSDTLQVWQEQVNILPSGLPSSARSFVRATQILSPAGVPSKTGGDTESRTGCASALFDSSSTLVATRLDENPSTVWIWDTHASELRAILLFHAALVDLSWHPALGETLLIACEGTQNGPPGPAFAWDPLSEGPQSIDCTDRLPGPRMAARKLRALWLNLDPTADAEKEGGAFPASSPFVFVSDSQNFLLVSLGEAGADDDANDDQPPLPWSWPSESGLGSGHSDATGAIWACTNSGASGRAESPLELVPAPSEAPLGFGADRSADDDDESESELEDTFIHKRY